MKSLAFSPVSRRGRAGLVIAAGLLAASVSAAESPLPPLGFPQTMGVQLKNGADWTCARLEEAQALGFRLVRKGMYWNSVEKQKGVYDFSGYDEQLACAKKLGLTVVVTLFGSNDLYEKKEGVRGVLTEEGRKGFAAFAAAAATHYKGEKIIFEIWNEPNVRTFWGTHGTHNTKPFADQYSALVNAAVPEMVKADPDCFVVAGSVSNYWEPSYQWTEFCFQNGVLKSGIRGWSVHPYGVKTPEEHAIGHARERELLVKYGAPELPLVNTERGYSVSKTETGEGWSGGEESKTLDYQASQFVRQILVDQLCGVRFSSWYEWGGTEGFGLWNPDGSPRPVVAAIKEFVAQLGGYHIVERLASDSKLDYVLLCENVTGEKKLVAWTCPPAGGMPDEVWDHDIAVDQGTGKEALAIKLTGKPQYVAVAAGAKPGKSVTTSVRPVAAPVVAATPAGGVDLKLFESGAEWSFEKNTGEGSFTLAKDAEGKAIGVLAYDFTNSKSKNKPYVLASTHLSVAEGASALLLYARSTLAQPLTFRVTDSTEQTLQFKMRLKGTGQWEEIKIPLNKKLEHWGGDDDGKVHFPLKGLVFSVPQPGEEKVGKVEYSAISSLGGGAAVSTVAAPEATAAAGAVSPQPAQRLEGAVALKLFDADKSWKFEKNTGEGSFELSRDAAGQAVGTMAFDFSKSTTSSTPYVLASAAVSIAGGEAISFSVRTAVPQKLTFRVVDSTGQTLQFKTKAKGTGTWEAIRLPLNKKLEHWDGANDGLAHFPLTSITFSVPRPAPDVLIGKVEYTEAFAQ